VVKHTSADAAFALYALVKTTDLGSEWKRAGMPPLSPSVVTCTKLKPDESSLVETGIAGATFNDPPWRAVTGTVRVFATSSQASTAWLRTDNLTFVACDEEYLKHLSQRVVKVARLQFPRVTRDVAAYRIVAAMSQAPSLGQSSNVVLPVYYDFVLISSGRTQELVVFSAIARPFSRAFEVRTARTVAGRLSTAAPA